ncbi:beta-glucosidase [Anaerocolumna jejuensis DSM 15929]|uniref:Beta-glucosidase n=1 Tax=Anaerocolumna jejuensis DSM 15929 TaxID=1121322 RepID=A0A1M7BV19_9FIRM|nr:glycoside hydrolase family 3 C-terminal domain-containing protein [Anaerocolumna jejuensis]SHL58429.1 beta-glucosidase [Anaerocolumna jejuensis DSM 15929]
MEYKDIIQQMSLEDKIALCSGADFFHTKEMKHYGIPEMMMCDGPHGLRKQEDKADNLGVNQSVPATSFPTAAATACSWDTELLGKIGAAIAKEAAANKVGVVLGPGVCIKRNPVCGRNFEYFSEDPYLAGKLGAGFIREAQKKGVGTSLKHFACNNQEYKRFSSDSILDERTLREIYLTGFEIAVKEGNPATVMCAYNKINGTYCSDSKELLNDILRKDWSYKGLVVTDWGAMHNRIEGFQAGCDLSMPGGSSYMEKETLEAVKNGRLKEELIDLCASRVISMITNALKALGKNISYDIEGHHELARIAAEQSAVLLKNDNDILPLKSGCEIGLIGYMAKEIRYQGAGSSHINPTKLVNVTDVICNVPYEEGCDSAGNTTQELLDRAVALAERVEIPVIFAGLTEQYESEGFDRKDMKMPEGHNRMISAVAKANPNTVIVLMCGSVVEVPWIDKVKAVLYMALPGQAGGEAIVNLLYGKMVPCGKLAETWPVKYEDCVNASYYGNKDAQYREGIYVGYRYYDKSELEVRFPFGYGLSYTKFHYTNLSVEPVRGQDDYQFKITLDVTNTGTLEAAEIVQLYVAAPQDGIYRPVRELKGFKKLFLKPGETKKADFMLDERSFAIWQDGWRVLNGNYNIQVGSNSRNITLEKTVMITGEVIKTPEWQKSSWYEKPIGAIQKLEWEKLLGRKVVEKPLKKGEFTMENSIVEMKKYSILMKIMYKAVERTVAKGFDGKIDYNNSTFRMMMSSSTDSSLSSMKINGGMRNYIFEGLLEMVNGHYLLGIKYMLKK